MSSCIISIFSYKFLNIFIINPCFVILTSGQSLCLLFFFLIYLFFGCIGSSVAVSGGYSSCGVPASHPGGFSCCRARAPGAGAQYLWLAGSRAQAQVVAHRLSCSAACGIFPRPGLEPMSPALAGEFLTTAPPGKPTVSASVNYFFSS